MFLSFISALSFVGIIYGRSRKFTYLFLATTFIFIFSWMNINKSLVGDWVWYTDHYKFMATIPFLDYLGGRFDSINIKWNEPIYYLLAYNISLLSGANIAILAIFITVCVYALVAVSMLKIDDLSISKSGVGNNSLVVCSSMLLSITFTLTTHLVRQEIAIAFLAVGYYYLARRAYIYSCIFITISILCHQSSLFPVVVLIFPLATAMAFRTAGLLRTALFVLTPLISASFGYIIMMSEIGGSKDDGSISISIIVLDIIISLLTTYAVIRNKWLPLHYRIIPITFLSVASCLLILSSNPLAILRLYFYVDFLRGISILLLSTVIRARVPKELYITYSLTIFLAAILMTEIRIFSAPFDFGGLLYDYLLFPFI